MTLTQALILGIVEGITEFLPISSTAHLLIAQKLAGIPLTPDLISFDIAIQLGAILAVVVMSGKRLLTHKKLLSLVIIAFVPTALIGLVMYDVVTSILFRSTTGMLLALIVGGVVMILVEKYKKEGTKTELTWKDAFLIGVFQSLAMMPGVSRAAATIIGGMLLGVTRKDAVEFSFLVAIPTMLAATTLDLINNPSILQQETLAPFAVGFLAAFVMALLSIRWLRTFISTNTFTPFGVYRIVVAFALFWIFT